MENWLVGRMDSRRRLIMQRGFPAMGRFFGQAVSFALGALETLDQQFTPRGQFTLWGLTAVSTGAFSVEIRISGGKG
ncbi:MAG TPA: hypothetical protein VFJ52_02445, partial [Terriglobia bacterium]|nr:hypothetical protein [Terriglobia bacterium]